MGSNSSTTIRSPSYYKKDTKENKKIESILKKTETHYEEKTQRPTYPNRKANSHQHLRTRVVHPQTATRSSPSLLYGVSDDIQPISSSSPPSHHNDYHDNHHEDCSSPKISQSPRLSKRTHPQLSPIRSNSPQLFSPTHPSQLYGNHSNNNQFDEFDVFGHRGSISSETSLSSLSTSSSVVSFSPSLSGIIPMPTFQPHPPIISLLNRSNSVKRNQVNPLPSPNNSSSNNIHASPKKRTTLISDTPFTTPQMISQQTMSPTFSQMYKRSTTVVESSGSPTHRSRRSSSVNQSNYSFQTNASVTSLLNPSADKDVKIPLLAVTRPETPPCTSNIPISARSSDLNSNKRYLSVTM